MWGFQEGKLLLFWKIIFYLLINQYGQSKHTNPDWRLWIEERREKVRNAYRYSAIAWKHMLLYKEEMSMWCAIVILGPQMKKWILRFWRVGWLLSEPAVQVVKPWGVAFVIRNILPKGNYRTCREGIQYSASPALSFGCSLCFLSWMPFSVSERKCED